MGSTTNKRVLTNRRAEQIARKLRRAGFRVAIRRDRFLQAVAIGAHKGAA